MTDEQPETREEANRRLVERMEQAAKNEDVHARARHWRHVSFAERARIGIELIRFADKMARERVPPYLKPPLAPPLKSLIKPKPDD